jgi:hypothetical protein
MLALTGSPANVIVAQSSQRAVEGGFRIFAFAFAVAVAVVGTARPGDGRPVPAARPAPRRPPLV